MAALLLTVFYCSSCGKDSAKNNALVETKQLLSPEEGTGDQNFRTDQMTDKTDTTLSPHQQPRQDQMKEQKNAADKPDWDKKIIKTASINLEVKDYNAYYAGLREKVRSFGGYMAQEEQTQSDYNIQNNLVIKVPVDQFDNAVFQLTQNVEKLNEKKISSQDVSSEFVDTKSRIETKKQVRLKYLELLKQAKNMEEILSVQSEVNEIQEQIESATDHVEYLSHASAFSTINLTYYQVLNPSAKSNGHPGFSTRLGLAFRNGASWFVDLFVELVSIWPVFLGVIALIFFYKRSKKQVKKQALQ
jgi:hypothetical protein